MRWSRASLSAAAAKSTGAQTALNRRARKRLSIDGRAKGSQSTGAQTALNRRASCLRCEVLRRHGTRTERSLDLLVSCPVVADEATVVAGERSHAHEDQQREDQHHRHNRRAPHALRIRTGGLPHPRTRACTR
eukprot:5595872-Pleurochrysis_carterae.AAC.4